MENKENTGNTTVKENTLLLLKRVQVIPLNEKRVFHPPTREMVKAAINAQKDRRGTSFQAIRKYVISNYKLDGEKITPYIKRYLRYALKSGAIIQTKGKGVCGSFKLPSKKMSKMLNRIELKKAQEDEKADPIKTVPAAKKAATEKKPVTVRKGGAKAVARPKVATEAKNISKSNKTTNSSAAKTKSYKSKKVGE